MLPTDTCDEAHFASETVIACRLTRTRKDVIGLPHYKIIDIQKLGSEIEIAAEDTSPQACPDCGSTCLRNKGVLIRRVRHASWAAQRFGFCCVLHDGRLLVQRAVLAGCTGLYVAGQLLERGIRYPCPR